VTEQGQARAAYAGLVTRAIAIGIDLLVVNGLAVLAAGAVNLIASMLGHKTNLSSGEILAGGAAWLFWIALYFVAFWTITGQTVGSRVLGIRVVAASGGNLRLRPAIRRYFAMLLAALPLGAGFLPVLFDERRRGFHDRVARTVVRWVEAKPAAWPRVDAQPAAPPPVEPESVIEADEVVVLRQLRQ
jgi:uncharacterized RDD family membrane protein YckC